ncbi:MAG TPA: phosphoribosylamine--glycine ligase [Gaiellaceae bacterium]|nr:phosphoribosylamine--glycine ligase [Gaiellaceae bacterium]
MKVLVVGSGGREHALAWKLAQSPELDELHAAPGNPGIASLGTCHPVRGEDAEGLLELARTLEIDLVVVGPEAPLVAGVADELRHGGVSVFGPSAAAAQIEGSKSFAKTIMVAAGVPNPRELAEPEVSCVVKVDGLAAGKGVFVCRTEAELEDGLRSAAALGGKVIVEELLEGDELSVFALCDGSRALPLGAARDYKRAEDGDSGPNTGGMGSYSPVDGFDPARIAELVQQVHAPVLEQLARRGAPFIGVLFAGLMLTDAGPQVLEFNCRFGDPEAQTILAAHDDDLLPALAAAAAGDAAGFTAPVDGRAAVTVVVTAGSYPESGDTGSPIDGVAAAEATGALVFHAGTARRGGALVTNGGRILAVTGRGDSVADARGQAYAGAERISFPGARYRRDVANG